MQTLNLNFAQIARGGFAGRKRTHRGFYTKLPLAQNGPLGIIC
jgi:hypothetical protein